jgi:hypothetical protein
MPNPLVHPGAWTVDYDAEEESVRISPAQLRLPAAIELVIFLGGGFTATQAAWRVRASRAVLRIDVAGTA